MFTKAQLDPKNYTNPRKIQRFSLATLYYSTNGEEWLDQCNFMNVFLHVCDWNCPWPIETNPQIAEYVELGFNRTGGMGIDCWDGGLNVISIEFGRYPK